MVSLLVRTPAPCLRESLQSYILRLSESNGYDTPVHILHAAGLTAHSMHSVDVPLDKLVAITRRDIAMLQSLSNKASHHAYHSKILNENLKRSASTSQFDLKRAFFCPQCVQNDGYIEAFWSLSYAVGCPKHGIAPITHCVECGEKVSWFRQGLLTCRCGADFSDQMLEPLDEPESELMKIIFLKANGLSICGLKNKSKYPLEYFEELSLSSLFLIMNLLHKLYYKCHEGASSTHSNAVTASVSIFKGWPYGYYDFLNNLGNYYEKTRPAESSLRKQFELFYIALFKNSTLKKDSSFLKNEFIEFGKGVWGKGHIDKKLLDGQSITRGMRYLTKTQFCEITGMSPRVLNMIIDSPYINKKHIRTSTGRRVIIDKQGTLIPEVFIKTIPIREAGAQLGVPVSVFKYLKEGLISTDSVSRGRKETWFVEELELLISSAVGNAKPTGFYKQEMVSLQSLLRKKLGSNAVKAEIVSAVIDGRVPTESSASDKLSDFLVDKEKALALIERHKSRKEQTTLTFPDAAKRLGLDMTVINDAIQQGLLVSTEVNGRVRITEESVSFCSEKYLALSGLSAELNTSTKLLLRLCKSKQIAVVSLKRNSKKSDRGHQPIILRTGREELVIARKDELKRARKKQRKDLSLEYENSVRRYFKELERTPSVIPIRAGKLNKVAIAKACGFSRHILYTYPSVIKLMNELSGQC